MVEIDTLSPRHSIITVPRGHHRSEAAVLAKCSRTRSRLPNHVPVSTTREPHEDVKSVDALLLSSESDDDDDWGAGASKARRIIDRTAKGAAAHKLENDHNTNFDSESCFEDPFASSDDEETKPNIRGAPLHSCSSEESLMGKTADQDHFQAKSFEDVAKDFKRGSDTDDENCSSMQATSPLTPRIVIAHSGRSQRSTLSTSGPDFEGASESNHQTEQPIHGAGYSIDSLSRSLGLSSDSESENAPM